MLNRILCFFIGHPWYTVTCESDPGRPCRRSCLRCDAREFFLPGYDTEWMWVREPR